jgi:hypothetical protein
MPSDEIAAILQDLEAYDGIYPWEAVNAAMAQREEIIPRLIDSLEKIAAEPTFALEDEDYFLHNYAVMLLGHFREPRAHRAIVDVFGLPDDRALQLFGDLITEHLSTVLFNTCGGNYDLIKKLIVNRRSDEFARGEAARAMVYGVATGQLPREEVLDFFSTLFTGDEAEKLSAFWGLVAEGILDLHPRELMPLIQEADERGLLNGSYLVEEDFVNVLPTSVEDCLNEVRQEIEGRSLDDLHGVISAWPCFSEPGWEPDASLPEIPKAKNKKPQKKRKKKMAKASRRKNRR